jgi:hypothetical protein
MNHGSILALDWSSSALRWPLFLAYFVQVLNQSKILSFISTLSSSKSPLTSQLLRFPNPPSLYNSIHIQLKTYQNEVHHSRRPAPFRSNHHPRCSRRPEPSTGSFTRLLLIWLQSSTSIWLWNSTCFGQGSCKCLDTSLSSSLLLLLAYF